MKPTSSSIGSTFGSSGSTFGSVSSGSGASTFGSFAKAGSSSFGSFAKSAQGFGSGTPTAFGSKVASPSEKASDGDSKTESGETGAQPAAPKMAGSSENGEEKETNALGKDYHCKLFKLAEEDGKSSGKEEDGKVDKAKSKTWRECGEGPLRILQPKPSKDEETPNKVN